MTIIPASLTLFFGKVVAFLVVYCRCFVRVVEWRYATIRKRLCDYSYGAMRIVGRREADFFMHLWAFVWGCSDVVEKWLFIPVKK